MNNLSEVMQSRLDKWRQNTMPVPSMQKLNQQPVSRRNGKSDRGDAMTQEEWEEEARKSQNRK